MIQGRVLALVLGFALTLGGCGKQTTAPQGPAGRTPPVAPAKSAAPQGGVALAQKPSKATRLNEDGSETVEDSSGDSGAHNPLLAAVASTVTGSATASAVALTGPTLWQPGVNYTVLVPGQPTDVPPGQIEVLWFFWYACPHCYALNPTVDSWAKTKPAYVTFKRVPVMWSDSHRDLAHLFYTLQALGKLNELNDAVFKEIQVNGDALTAADTVDPAATEHMQMVFARKFGIAEDDFRKAYESMGVAADLRKADELGQRYRVAAVPTFVINGKFIADVTSAGGPEKVLALVDDLAAAEHKR